VKNGIAIEGHRRILLSIGLKIARNRAPSGGWNLSCWCGWDGGWHRIVVPAQRAYRAHLEEEINRKPRRCRRCGEEKNPDEMAPATFSRHICRACWSKKGNEWQVTHPIESLRHKRKYSLLKHYGITLQEADQLLKEQGGVCAICGDELRDSRGYSPHIDHDHVTGKIRGILCFNCNSGLGQFKDDPRLLQAALRYLTRVSIITSGSEGHHSEMALQ